MVSGITAPIFHGGTLKAERQAAIEQARAATATYQDTVLKAFGQVADLPAGEDFAFLMTKEGGLLYFHRNSILAGRFEDLKVGTEVSYVEEMGDTGPIASKVRLKASD